MANFRALLMAALLGGLAGAALVWLITKSDPTVSVIAPVEHAALPGTATQRKPIARLSVHEAVDAADARTIATKTPPVEEPSAQNEPLIQARRETSGDSDTRFPHALAPSQSSSITAIENVTVTKIPRLDTAAFTLSNKPSLSKNDAAAIQVALAFALNAAEPSVRQGFTIRQDYWGGVLAGGGTKTIVHQLFRGNEYWFWLGTDRPVSLPAVHIYDPNGNLAEAEHWQQPRMAAARVVPGKTGSYYITIEVGRVNSAAISFPPHWALTYGFR